MRMVKGLYRGGTKHTARSRLPGLGRTAAGPTGAQLQYHAARAALFCPSFPPFVWNTMPTYHIEMLEGRTIEQKRKLVQEITRVTVEVLGGSPESVDILITDVKRENWSTGGKLWTEPRT
jgi:4-oxalocrotonate tautomerase